MGKKESKCSRQVAELSEFWRGQRLIKLLDPNILACGDHEKILTQLADCGAKVDFTQGLDIRLKELRKKAAAYNKQLREYCQQNGLKYRDDRVRTYGKITAKKPDKDLTGGGNVDIIETDNIVDLCTSVPSQKGNKPAFSSEDIKQIETELQRIPEKHRNVIEQTVKHVAIAQTSDGSYNAASKTLKLKPGVIHETFIHECGHILADAYKVYDDPEFIDILCDGLDLNPYSIIPIYYEPKKSYVFLVSSEKFVDPYQGRCYINMDNLARLCAISDWKNVCAWLRHGTGLHKSARVA